MSELLASPPALLIVVFGVAAIALGAVGIARLVDLIEGEDEERP